jgi:heme-degrading monooxygenase HmoA
MIALLFRYDARDPEEFEQAYGPDGEWARFFRQGAGFIGTELLRDLEEPDRYVVIDRWESIDAYNTFLSKHQAEYLRRGDESRFYYMQELRFGTFENVWHEPHPAAP